MSYEYDEYLNEHISNVKKGLEWMRDNLDLHGDDITDAIIESEEHDRSKYCNPEYNDYDAYFYGGNRSYQVVMNFNYAWLLHQHKNPHHWQYWVLINDDEVEGMLPLPMPLRYIYEMIADWWTFSWKDGNLFEIFDWYELHKDYILLHRTTRIVVEDLLKRMREKLELDAAIEYLEGLDIQHDDLEDKKFGVPEQKKFPMPDADHVHSAIRFFNYVDPEYEEDLAKAILMRAKEYGVDISKINVGDENRFKNYIPKKEENNVEESSD